MLIVVKSNTINIFQFLLYLAWLAQLIFHHCFLEIVDLSRNILQLKYVLNPIFAVRAHDHFVKRKKDHELRDKNEKKLVRIKKLFNSH
jgi:hypothetical protein